MRLSDQQVDDRGSVGNKFIYRNKHEALRGTIQAHPREINIFDRFPSTSCEFVANEPSAEKKIEYMIKRESQINMSFFDSYGILNRRLDRARG